MAITVLENPAQTGFLHGQAAATSRLNQQQAAFDSARSEWQALLQKKAELLAKGGAGGMNPAHDAAIKELDDARNAYRQYTNFDEDGNQYFRANAYQNRVVDPQWQRRLQFEKDAKSIPGFTLNTLPSAVPSDAMGEYKYHQFNLDSAQQGAHGYLDKDTQYRQDLADARRQYDAAVAAGNATAQATAATKIQAAQGDINSNQASYTDHMGEIAKMRDTLERVRNQGATGVAPYNTGPLGNSPSTNVFKPLGDVVDWLKGLITPIRDF